MIYKIIKASFIETLWVVLDILPRNNFYDLPEKMERVEQCCFVFGKIQITSVPNVAIRIA